MDNRIEKIIKKVYDLKEVRENPSFYIYDSERIKEKIALVEKYSLDNVKLYYSMKANPNQLILKLMSQCKSVSGIEIASDGELEIALGSYSADKILFTSPGKTVKELENSIKAGIKYLNCESIVEAIRISEICQKNNVDKVNILLRVNPDFSVNGAGQTIAGISTKMGIDQCEFFNAYKFIKCLKAINVCGIHVFAASNVLDYKNLIIYVKQVFKFVKDAEDNGVKIDTIDFGGGFGIDYDDYDNEFNVKAYFEDLDKLVNDFGFRSKELILELGRYLVGESGYYVAEIIDIKDIKGHKHMVVAGGINHMRLPIAMEQKHPSFIIRMNADKLYPEQPGIKDENVDVEGPLCMSDDLIAWDEYIETADIGDLYVLRQSGAYCYSCSALSFLSHLYPEEYLVNDSEITRI